MQPVGATDEVMTMHLLRPGLVSECTGVPCMQQSPCGTTGTLACRLIVHKSLDCALMHGWASDSSITAESNDTS